MMPFYGGFAGGGYGGAGYGALRQGQQVYGQMPPIRQLGGGQPGYGQGFWGAGGGGMYGGGYGGWSNRPMVGGSDYGVTRTAAPPMQQPQVDPAQQPNYTGLPGGTNSGYGQQYGQFLGQMYQPPQQINYSAAPIANRPMTYRPIQQNQLSFGSYSRY